MTEHVTVCDQAYDPSTTPKYDLHSVSSLTTYQLRQELVRLGAFERFFPPEKVQYCCYDSLLEAHITLLREAKAEEEAAQFARHNAEVEARKAALAQAKALRKKEAEERQRKARLERQRKELTAGLEARGHDGVRSARCGEDRHAISAECLKESAATCRSCEISNAHAAELRRRR